jgi:hypothetical protein
LERWNLGQKKPGWACLISSIEGRKPRSVVECVAPQEEKEEEKGVLV